MSEPVASSLNPVVLPDKIVWLCGAFEPGRDGVGDYVRTVRGGLRSGNTAAEQTVVALSDAWVSDVREDGDVLRLPATGPLARNISAAAAFLDRFQPDVLAWNFVPQMFAPRGIVPAKTVDAYARLRADRRLILFMHELWCGTGREDTVRNWMTGAVQRRGVLYWLERHQPERVLTSNAAYAAVLQRYGIDAAIVPLCSNIARVGAADRRRWPAALAGHRLAALERASFILAGVFGAIHPIWKPEPALNDLASHARRVGKKLAVVWFGQGSISAEESWQRVISALGCEICFARLGPLDEPAASALLENCDLGLPTIQFNLLGKSGTAAAFLEHGVPLLVVSDAWTPRFPGFERGAADDSVVLWTENNKLDWEKLLASRPQAGRQLEKCVDGWRRALAVRRDEPVSSLASCENS